jgi:hypothetical protein
MRFFLPRALALFGLACFAGALAPSLVAEPPYPQQSVDVAPVLKKPVKVRYPYSSRKKHGEIVLRFVVTERGEVAEMVMMRTTDPDMVPPAMDAYEKAQYQPGLKDGKPVATIVEVVEKAEK